MTIHTPHPLVGQWVIITADNTRFHGCRGLVREADERGVAIEFAAEDNPAFPAQQYWFTNAEFVPAPGDYRQARGVIPVASGAELPEDVIRRMRDGEAAE